MPTAAASRKPPYTRCMEAKRWVRIVPLKASSYTPPKAKSRIITATIEGVGTSLVPDATTPMCHSRISASGKLAPSRTLRRRSNYWNFVVMNLP